MPQLDVGRHSIVHSLTRNLRPSSTTYPSQFNGKVFLLEYEGAGNLQGLPERRTDNNYLKLINPKSGTQMVDADNSSKGYVVKATGTGKMLAKHGTSTACDSMTFDFATSAIPAPTTKALPQSVSYTHLTLPTNREV